MNLRFRAKLSEFATFRYDFVAIKSYRNLTSLFDNPLRRNNTESVGISLKSHVIDTRTGNGGFILVKDSDNSCEFRLREQLFCRNKLINPVLSVRKLQYDFLSFENQY